MNCTLLEMLKSIEDKYNVKAYFYGCQARRFVKTREIGTRDLKILIDGKRNEEILKMCPYDVVFMSLDDFFNSRIVGIDKVVINSNGEPTIKGNGLKSLRDGILYFKGDTIKGDKETILSMMPYLDEGYSVDRRSVSSLAHKTDIDTLLEILELALVRDSFVGRNKMRFFYYLNGVDKIFNNESKFSFNETIITLNDLCWFNANAINRITRNTPNLMSAEFCKFKMFCFYLSMKMCERKNVSLILQSKFDEIECVTYLYKNILKLDDISLENHINKIKYFIEHYFKSGCYRGLKEYYTNFESIDEIKKDKIDVNFYYASLLI